MSCIDGVKTDRTAFWTFTLSETKTAPPIIRSCTLCTSKYCVLLHVFNKVSAWNAFGHKHNYLGKWQKVAAARQDSLSKRQFRRIIKSQCVII